MSEPEPTKWSTPEGRCAAHDLALGPDGRCVMCRRVEAPPSRSAGSVMATCVVIVLVAVLAVLVDRELRAFAPPPPVERAPERVATAPSLVPALEPTPAEVAPEPPRRRRARSTRSEREEEPEEVAGEPEPARPSVPVRIGPAPDESAIGPAVPGDPPALAAARRRVRITMFSASWCGYCSAARTYMRSHDIRFTERDIDEPRWRTELREINPGGSIPTFRIQDDVVVGFSESNLERAIDGAAHDLLGR